MGTPWKTFNWTQKVTLLERKSVNDEEDQHWTVAAPNSCKKSTLEFLQLNKFVRSHVECNWNKKLNWIKSPWNESNESRSKENGDKKIHFEFFFSWLNSESKNYEKQNSTK